MNLQDFALKLQAQMQGRQSRFFGAARKVLHSSLDLSLSPSDAVDMQGENYELRADLNSEYRDRRKDAIKRVIANMTVGKVRLLPNSLPLRHIQAHINVRMSLGSFPTSSRTCRPRISSKRSWCTSRSLQSLNASICSVSPWILGICIL